MRDAWNSLSDTLSTIATVVGAVVAMGAAWAVIWTWVRTWDWMQRGIAIFIAICLAFLVVLALYTLWRKTQIRKIPALLYKLDSMLRDYVEQYEPDKADTMDVTKLVGDLAELMHIAIYPGGDALKKADKKTIREQTERFNRAIGSLNIKNNSTEQLKLLMQVSALMNEHNIGLKRVKDTPQYQNILKRIRMLERIQPSPYVSINIDNYFRWSDGWYSQLLGTKFITSKPDIFQLSPAEYRAQAAYGKPVIEDAMDVLIAQVAESLQEKKRKTESKKE
jgi:phosphate/sulfate permease